MLKVHNLDAFDGAVKAWLGAVEAAAAKAAVHLAQETFKQIVQGSPQYSGDFAASWRVGYGTVDRTYEENLFINEVIDNGPFQRGSRRAIDFALANAKWKPLKLGQTIYISNSATHDEPYAWKVEKGQIKFRPVNEGADHIARRTVTYVGNLYRNISASQLASMKVF